MFEDNIYSRTKKGSVVEVADALTSGLRRKGEVPTEDSAAAT